MIKEYKCATCKADKSLEKADRDRKFPLSEMKIINGNKYCLPHFEVMMDKKCKCSHCGKSLKRRDGVNKNVGIGFKDDVLQGKEKFFCSEECSKSFEEEIYYKHELIKDFMKLHNLKDTTEVPKVIYVQMASFKNKYDMSFKGMSYTMSYITSKRLSMPVDSLWLVVKEYDNARMYYATLNKRKREAENMDTRAKKTRYFKLPSKADKKERVSKILYLPED